MNTSCPPGSVRSTDIVVDLTGTATSKLRESGREGVRLAVANGTTCQLRPLAEAADSGSQVPAMNEQWRASLVELLSATKVDRVVLIANGHDPNADHLQGQLAGAEIETTTIRWPEGVDANDFVSAEDSEAVTERLRQLGYI